MTLLVRNEVDIIRHNIEFHLYYGVDQIVVTVNRSTDGTLDVLREYEKEGFVKIIQEPSLDFDQARWVTRMARIARDELHADWIIHNDADEFWYPDSGDIKAALISTGFDVCMVERINMLYPWDGDEDEPWHQRLVYRMNPPFHSASMEDPYRGGISNPHFCCSLPSKIACVARELKEVEHGNHDVVFEGKVKKGNCPGILIYHFPFRSRSRFLKNTCEIGECLSSSPISINRPRVGWHRRRWYNLMQKGYFDQVFEETMISRQSLQVGLREGFLIEDRTIMKVFED